MICIQLIDRFRYGGAERVALTYLQSLNSMSDIRSVIWALKDPERNAEENVRLFSNHFVMFFSLLKQIYLSDTTFFCHTTRSLIICSLLKFLFRNKIKIIYIRHFQYTSVTQKILKRIRFLIDKAILITPAEETVAIKLFSQKLHYINNYIVVDKEEGCDGLHIEIQKWANNRKIIAFAGAMKKGKHPVHLLELSKYLGTEDYCYLFIGDGPERKEVEAFHQANKDFLHNAVFYCGFQNDVISFLKMADSFFFTSWNNYEMMPMVLLEALTANCKCFAYKMEVNKYILPEEHLFDFRKFDAIANAIRGKKIKQIPNKFDSDYGIMQLGKLLSSLK